MHFFCSFIYTFFLTLSFPVFFPSWHFLFFAPFIVQNFYYYSFLKCLWLSFFCGLVIDLLSSQSSLGIYAFNYSFVTFCLFRYRCYFFEDGLSTIPVMTFFFVFLSILLQTTIFYFTQKSFSLSWEWMIKELVQFPLQNAIFAGIAFTFPSLILSPIKRSITLFAIKRRKI